MERKKFPFLLVCLFCLFGGNLWAQIQLVNETFSGSFPPAGWTLHTTGTVNWARNSAGRTDTSATSCTNTNNQGIASLVSPTINLSGLQGDSLFFYWRHSSTTIVKEFDVVGSRDNGSTFPDTLYKISLNTSQFSGSVYGKSELSLSAYSNTSQFKIKFAYNPKGNSSTGQIVRVDDISVSAKLLYNLSVSSIIYSPAYPFTTDSLTLTARVKNVGIKKLLPDSVVFYFDSNADGFPQGNERFKKRTGTDSISAGDSSFFSVPFGNLVPGTNRFIVRSYAFLDNDPTNDQRSLNVTATVPTLKDLAISRFIFTPAQPETLITFSITAANRGTVNASGYILELYRDVNMDSVIQPGELIRTLPGGVIPANDTIQFHLTYSPLPFGSNRFFAKIALAGDEVPSNDISKISFTAYAYKKSIVVNEIMYAPNGDEPEWVELINASPDTINLKNWKFSDSNLNLYPIITTNRFISPSQFLILTANLSGFLMSHPEVTNPVIAPANWPILNNTTPDAVILYDNRSISIDSVRYSQSWGGNSSGRSLERKEIFGNSNDPGNWGNSSRAGGSIPGGGTPGQVNSISQKDFDLKLLFLRISPSLPLIGGNAAVNVRLKNIGKKTASLFGITLYHDLNADSLTDAGEILQQYSNPGPLNPGDSLSFSTSIYSLKSKTYFLIARIPFASDQDSTNNTIFYQFRPGVPPQTVIINEILYAPKTNEKEWIEIYNTSGDSISVADWKISDDTSFKKNITASSIKIAPRNFMILSENPDSLNKYHPGIPVPMIKPAGWPSLNDNGDDVILYDSRGGTLDSVAYSNSWGGENGKSLERKEPFRNSNEIDNWTSSMEPARSTPGKINSVTQRDFDLSISPSAIFYSLTGTPPGQNISFRFTVDNVGKQNITSFSLSIFFDANNDQIPQSGERVDTLQIKSPSFPVRVIRNLPAVYPPGVYHFIIKITQAADEMLSNNTAAISLILGYAKNDVVVNEIMYSPKSGQPEWIELFNRSDHVLNIKNWKFSDSSTNTVITSADYIINAGELITVAADSSILSFYSFPIGAPVLKVNDFPTLNNDEDDVKIFDASGTTIDSVHYSSIWGGRAGTSLERINPNLPGNDSRNWSTSLAPGGASPGKTNSVYAAVLPSSATIAVSPNPFSPDEDGWEDFAVISFHLPMITSFIRMRIYDVEGRLIRTLMNNEPSGSSNSVIWDGKDNSGRTARIGIYIILLEASNDQQQMIKNSRATIVVARKL